MSRLESQVLGSEVNSETTSAFLLAATLHGAVIALALLLGYATSQSDRARPKVLELVAGEGDNYMANVAPALGVEGGIKVPLNKAAEAKPTPPEPVPVRPEPAPITPAPPVPKPSPPAPPVPKPVTPAPTKATEPAAPDFKKQIKQDVRTAVNKAKKEIAKERAAEKKRLEEEAKRMTKEEFDRANKAKSVASVNPKNPAVKKIDVEGIAKGVAGGSSANKVGGAGGKAMTSDNSDVLAAYDALFKQRLREKFEPPPGLSDSLKVTIEVRSASDGSLSGARVVRSSGSKEFDFAVLDAIKRVRMPSRPDKKGETVEFDFSMRERGEG